MQKLSFLFFLVIICDSVAAQKKPLDHSVYDDWQSIGDKLISRDGNWIVYTIDKQEGDKQLVIQSATGDYKKLVDRGNDPVISHDSKWVAFRISPFYADTRDAKIKKKKADDSPKDSLGLVELGKDSVWKRPRVKEFSFPESGSAVLAYQLEKPIDPVKAKTAGPDKARTDSLGLVIDSLKAVINGLSSKKPKKNEDRVRDHQGSRLQDGLLNSPEADETLTRKLSEAVMDFPAATDFAEGDDPPAVSEAGTE
ncbi:MAG: hypothetical protein EOO05_17030, partial [Chitinophagaceae bacterium]